MAQGSLQIADEEFFTAPFKNRERIEDPLLAQEKDALVVDAPRKVPLDLRRTLPLAVLRVAHFAVASGVPLEKFGIVVAADAASGRVRVGRAITPTPKREQPEEPREGEGMTGEALVLDVREQVDLPWRPSQIQVSLIVRELISETMQVKLDYSPGAYRDEAVEAQRMKELQEAPLPKVYPAPAVARPGALPAYGRVEGAPPVPDEPGLFLAADRVVKLKADAPLAVKGSFRVKLPGHLFVDTARARAVPLEPKPKALVPVTLVITASKAPAPFVYEMVVPSWEADPKSGLAAGSFAIDLDKVGTLRTVPRTLFVYAFCGDQRFGPLPIGLAGEDQ
ncbi:MAG TPA: hypothetical protein VEP66_20845 [Myxococcales bacterium]|nr:hypothetical protein [Myxococcales bacterium]